MELQGRDELASGLHLDVALGSRPREDVQVRVLACEHPAAGRALAAAIGPLAGGPGRLGIAKERGAAGGGIGLGAAKQRLRQRNGRLVTPNALRPHEQQRMGQPVGCQQAAKQGNGGVLPDDGRKAHGGRVYSERGACCKNGEYRPELSS